MSVRWERFAGDTSSFAVRLSFHRDPDEGAGATPEMAESWGAIQIWVRGVNLCAHIDQGETLHASHWYMLPLLEWLAANWDPLLHEQRPPIGVKSMTAATDIGGVPAALTTGDVEANPMALDASYEWEQRHSLRSSRDGGILPDVRLRRLGDRIEVSWRSFEIAGADNVEFLTAEGAAHLEPTTVAGPLFDVLESASSWLREQLPTSERCSTLALAVSSLRDYGRTEERTGWIAGLGFDRARMADRWRQIKDRASQLRDGEAFDAVFGGTQASELVLTGSCDAALLFGSASPTITMDDAERLATLLLEAYEPAPTDGLATFVFDEPIDVTRRPWQQGYELAADLLDDIADDLDGSAVDIEALLAGWGVRVSDSTLDDRQLRAVAFVSGHHSPTVALNSQSPANSSRTGRRFTLAHELCHLLHDRSFGSRLAIASGPWAPRAIEQRANAFAAWLLMPPSLVTLAIAETDARVDTRQGIEAVAARLQVSRAALLEHLHNVGILDEADRDGLRLAFEV